MDDVLQTLVPVSTFVFTVSSMLSVGLSYSLREVLAPLRNVHIVLLVLVANFVLVPLYAVGLLLLFSLEPAIELGLLLLATGAGAPFLIKLTRAAQGNVAKSATLLVVLAPATVLYMPLVVPRVLAYTELVSPGGAAISVGSIAWPLVIGLLLPLAVGLALESLTPRLASRAQAPIGRLASIALVVLVAALFLSNLEGVAAVFGTGAILAAILFVLGAFILGYAVAGRSAERRVVFGLGTAQRNVAAATVVATQSIGNPDTLVMVVVTTLVGMAVLFPAAALLRRKGPGPWTARGWGRNWGTPVRP